jgi:hypothetical protein
VHFAQPDVLLFHCSVSQGVHIFACGSFAAVPDLWDSLIIAELVL